MTKEQYKTLVKTFLAYINSYGTSTISPDPVYQVEEKDVFIEDDLLSFIDNDHKKMYSYTLINDMGLIYYKFEHFKTLKLSKS